MTGSIQEKNGKYQIVLNFKDSEGKRKQKWISTGLDIKGNKRKAEELLKGYLSENEESDYIEPTKTFLHDFIEKWIELNKANIQVTTYDGYKHILKKHIIPYFQEHTVILNKVKPIDIQRYYAFKSEEGLSPNTIIKHHGVIRTALQYAVKIHMIKENVADLVDKPKREKFHNSFYNGEELSKLFSVTKGYPIEIPIVLAVYYGLRRSEILGLRFDAIDFDNRIIKICNKVIRGHDENGTLTGMPEKKLKSDTSYRSLPLCDDMFYYLKEVKEKINNNMFMMGNTYNHKYDGYVCVNQLGNLIQPDYVSDMFPKLLDKYGLRKIRFHDLRHSCATLLLSLGYSMKEIQEWLGHSDFMITANTYTHVDYKNKIRMINSVENVLNGNSMLDVALDAPLDVKLNDVK